MENLPFYVSLVFGLTVLLSFLLFYRATNLSKTFAIMAIAWLTLQSIVSWTGFYQNTSGLPPRFVLLALPPVIMMIALFATTKGKQFINSLDPKMLTLFHIVRIPVEIVLFLLAIHKTIPELMTFEGRNFDILSGLSAPLVYYFGFVKHKMNRNTLLIWHFICLGLLINIVATAVLSIPTPFQKLAFDQPNIAIPCFPFTLLPGFIVPLVLFSHLVSVRQLLSKTNSQKV